MQQKMKNLSGKGKAMEEARNEVFWNLQNTMVETKQHRVCEATGFW